MSLQVNLETSKLENTKNELDSPTIESSTTTLTDEIEEQKLASIEQDDFDDFGEFDDEFAEGIDDEDFGDFDDFEPAPPPPAPPSPPPPTEAELYVIV